MIALMILLAVLIVLSALWLFLICPRLRHPDMTAVRTPFAHRGLYGEEVPENSLTAFARGADAGLGMEFDVQLSRDGHIMVFHDYSLTRMTGHKANLSELTREELKTLSLNKTAERIPTFDEVLSLVGGRVPLLIELKGEGTGGEAEALCQKVAERLDRYHGPFCLESFNPLLLRWFKKHRPAFVRGQLVTNCMTQRPNGNQLVNFALTHLLFNVLSRPDFIAFDGRFMKEPSRRLCTGLLGAAGFVWTILDAENFQKYSRWGYFPIYEHTVPPVPDGSDPKR